MADEPYPCEHVVAIDEEPRHHLVIENEYVRAFAVEIPPRDRTLCHRHGHDYLLYVASDAEIVSAARDEVPKRLSYRDGECELSTAGLTHVVENVGDSTFRNVVVEVLPSTTKLRRGPACEVTTGKGKVDEILQTPPGAVFSVQLGPGAEAGICGPAVVASPYRPLMMKEVDEFDIPLDGLRKLMWVCTPRQVAVRNDGQQAARLIVFQIGSNAVDRLHSGGSKS